MIRSPSLVANPLISTWLRFAEDGTVVLRVGKVELGQGIHTALTQIAVEELGVAPGRLVLAAPSTESSPDEGFTAGSQSTQISGAAVQSVCAAARGLFTAAAARRSGVPAASLTVVDGEFRTPGGEIVGSYGSLAGEVELGVEAPELPPRDGPAQPDLRRIDLPDKVFGRPRFIQDLDLPGMLHARVIRPPLLRASLHSLPDGLPASITLIQDGDFLAILAEREELAAAAAERLSRSVRWEPRDDMPDESKHDAWLRMQPCETSVLLRREGARGTGIQIRADYSRAMIAHASIATSCALARFDGRRLEVWSHSQGIFPLRAAIADALGMAQSDVVVHHVEGAGCYGHNPADDVAFDAALLALRTDGRPVRVLWDRAAELGSAPLASAMSADLSAELGSDGSVRNWTYDVWSNGYNGRPGYAGNPGLLANGYRAGGQDLPPSVDPPAEAGLGSGRNAVPPYSFESARVTTHRVLSMPIRTSAIRSLGAHFNVFAVESFMDELAARAGADPLEFRRSKLEDERARAVLSAAAREAGWDRRAETAEDAGLGLGYARYKNRGAYCAVVAEVEAAEEVRVRRIVVAVDVGRVVNLDGVRNQIEGGAIQAVSWTLKEQVRFGHDGITSVDWESYPVLRFPEVPRVDVLVLDRPDQPSLGAGECVAGPAAGAIANGVFAAIGLRVRTLPLTPQNVVRAIG
ncbi:molybdopterin cofactor-binding domain-containing protein [Nocardia alni]|uniref:molybdopterin cofactor-binding domain-containing protein n=1 Tax=Nocardia alni TaxID=2815723 RepID=UPI001C2472B6|nr:molybdopterin cofactor-binding domain-containing protein [Nocardia alni]